MLALANPQYRGGRLANPHEEVGEGLGSFADFAKFFAYSLSVASMALLSSPAASQAMRR